MLKSPRNISKECKNSLGDLNGYVQEKYDWVQCFKNYMVGKKETLEGFKQVNHRLNGFWFQSILYLRINVAIGSNDRLWDLYRGSCPW